MTTNKNVFKHVYGGVELRTIIDDKGNPWFVAKDVCTGLGLKGSVNSNCSKLCDFEKQNANRIGIITPEELKATKIITSGKALILISESGFYKLVMRSDKPEAVTFQRWVCEEVLPEIRKTGSYEAGTDAPAIIKDVAWIAFG